MLIIFTGGGTLGSVTPLLAAGQAIKVARPDSEFIWIGTEGGVEADTVRQAGLKFQAISSGKLRRYFSWRNFTDVFRIAAGFFQARRMFRERRPDVVVSAGGFVAVPVVWAAASIGIPVHVHQMDIRPGLANRLSARFARSFSVAYRKSLADFPARHPVWTGNPVRSEILASRATDRTAAAAHFRLDGAKPTVLILGGGTGAVALNDLAAKAAVLLSGRLNLIHVTGRGKEVALAAEAEGYRQFSLLGPEELALAYAAADLVVTRAGMGTLTELAALGKPAVIIPMPKSHQEENAELFRQAGAAEVWPETGLFSKRLADDLEKLLTDRTRLEAMGRAMGQLNRPDAAQAMAETIIAAATVVNRS